MTTRYGYVMDGSWYTVGLGPTATVPHSDTDLLFNVTCPGSTISCSHTRQAPPTLGIYLLIVFVVPQEPPVLTCQGFNISY